jgi:hypothetical protein
MTLPNLGHDAQSLICWSHLSVLVCDLAEASSGSVTSS